MTPISGLWLKFQSPKLVVLGNGKSRNFGVEFAKKGAFPVIAINDIPEGLNLLFSVITSRVFLKEVVLRNQNSIPLVIPAGFPQVDNSVSLPVSEFEYLEGTPTTTRVGINFREDFVLLTILDILSELSRSYSSNMSEIEVNLFGFDFEVDEDLENLNGNKFLHSLLERQKSIFSMLLKESRRSDNLILVNHSNTKAESETFLDMSVINKSVPPLTRASIDIAIIKNIELQKRMFDRAQAGDVQIVAELTNNHLGDTNRLLKMVEECKRQGADAIKIQKRDINFLYTEEERNSFYKSPFGETLGEYRAGVELTLEQIEYLTIRCAELNIPWFTSVLDSPSLKLIEHFQPLCIKAPSTISNHRNFLKDIASSQIQYIFVSTGATNSEFISWITQNFKDKQIVLMQCTSSYPTAPEDCNVAVVNTIANLNCNPPVIPGYSSHDIGSLASQVSVAFGAKFIEKHIKLGSVEWVHFDGVALDLSSNALKNFVEDIRSVQKVIGSGVKQQLGSEHHKYKPNDLHN